MSREHIGEEGHKLAVANLSLAGPESLVGGLGIVALAFGSAEAMLGKEPTGTIAAVLGGVMLLGVGLSYLHHERQKEAESRERLELHAADGAAKRRRQQFKLLQGGAGKEETTPANLKNPDLSVHSE